MKFNTIFSFIRDKILKYKITKTKPNRVSYYSLDKSGYFNKNKSLYAPREEKAVDNSIHYSVEDAEHIVENLNKIIHEHGVAFLADYEDLVGRGTKLEDYYFGWTSDVQYRIVHYETDRSPYHRYFLWLGNAKRL